MSDVKVTPSHRESACLALWPELNGEAREYIESGHARAYVFALYVSPSAAAIAQAEHRVRAAVIADLKAIADTADIVDQGSPVLYVRADSIESLIIELEAQQS